MRIGVVTPFHGESDAYLRRCVDSVRAQGGDVTHYMVGDGRRVDWLDAEPGVVQMPLGRPCRDYGDSPRAVGAVLAIKDGVEAVAFLDADNWYLPGHLTALADVAVQHAADVVTSARFFVRPDGSRIEGLADEPADRHTDTSCYFLTGRALRLAVSWGLWPKQFGVIDDRILWRMLIASGVRIVHVPRATVAYTSTWVEHYAPRGETPPPGAKSAAEVMGRADLGGWWRALTDADRERIRTLLGVPDFGF